MSWTLRMSVALCLALAGFACGGGGDPDLGPADTGTGDVGGPDASPRDDGGARDAAMDAAMDVGSDAPADAAVDVGGEDGGSADASRTDAGAADAGACDPFGSAGCPDGDRCVYTVEADGSRTGATACVAEGDVPVGEACETAAPSEGGLDDCVAGAFCNDGVCAAICDDDGPDTCGEGSHCGSYLGLFDEPGQSLDLCVESCDPLGRACADGTSCYLNLVEGEASCEPTGPEPLGQDELCELTNACAEHHGCVVPSYASTAEAICTFMCDAGGGGGPACDDPGGPGAEYTCVSLHTFWAGLPESVTADIGACVRCASYVTEAPPECE